MTDDLSGPVAAPLGGLLSRDLRVITAGTPVLSESLAQQAVPVDAVDWRPPPGEAVDALVTVLSDRRLRPANTAAVGGMLATRPHLVDVRQAGELLGLRPGTFLHAGPPIDWERASGPMRGALIGAMLFEGLAATPEEAERALAAGSVELDSCHHHATVGPMAGLVSPSMWLFVVEDLAGEGPGGAGGAGGAGARRSHCSLNEGLGKVLRYGSYGPEVIERLHWMSSVLGPVLQSAVRRHGPIDLKSIMAQALQMGDELHNRNRAATSLFVREMAGDIVEADAPRSDVAQVLRFINGNDHFFLNPVMAAAKLTADAARDVPGSSVVVAMARNGTDFGIQVSGTGDRWFTAPADVPDGLFLGSYGPEDANPDIGDSTITETTGVGGFAMAAAPAIVRFIGGEVPDALNATRRMYEITLAENPAFQIPIMSFRGTPTGIDITRVVRTGILPVINTGMAGKVAGTGQVGAGLVSPPADVFRQALTALAERVPSTG